MSKASIPRTNQRIIPYLTVQNLQEAVDFYQKAFGFELVDELGKDDQGNIIHATMNFNDAIVMFRPESEGTASKAPATLNAEAPTWIIVYCDDVDAVFEKAVSAGATVFHEPFDADWGDRMCKVADPNGHSWSFNQRI